MPSVLFVCTANVCRSPMAMAIFRKMVRGEGDQWIVESAGTWAINGIPAAPKTQILSKKHGEDLSYHRSRPVSKDLLNSFNLILTMEQGQKEALVIEFPESGERTFALSEMIDQNFDIPDPIGKSMEDFEGTYKEIEKTLSQGYDRILRLASS